MSTYNVASFCVLLFVLSYASPKEYPSRLPHCYRNDPKLDECLLAATVTMRQELINGVKEFEIPSIEPLIIPEAVLEQGTQALNFKIIIKNLTIHGLSSYKTEKFSLNTDTLTLVSRVLYGPLNMTGKCQFNGKILSVPLNGQGTVLISTGDVIVDAIIQGELVNNKGVDYFKVKNVTVSSKVSPGSSKARLKDFEGASPEIVTALNTVVEENTDDLIREFSSTLNEFLASFLDNLYTRVSKIYSYDDLFPLLP